LKDHEFTIAKFKQPLSFTHVWPINKQPRLHKFPGFKAYSPPQVPIPMQTQIITPQEQICPEPSPLPKIQEDIQASFPDAISILKVGPIVYKDNWKDEPKEEVEEDKTNEEQFVPALTKIELFEPIAPINNVNPNKGWSPLDFSSFEAFSQASDQASKVEMQEVHEENLQLQRQLEQNPVELQPKDGGRGKQVAKVTSEIDDASLLHELPDYVEEEEYEQLVVDMQQQENTEINDKLL